MEALWALGHEAVDRHARNGRGLTAADLAWDYRIRSLVLLFEGGARPPLPPAVHEVSPHSASLRLGLLPKPAGRDAALRRAWLDGPLEESCFEVQWRDPQVAKLLSSLPHSNK